MATTMLGAPLVLLDLACRSSIAGDHTLNGHHLCVRAHRQKDTPWDSVRFMDSVTIYCVLCLSELPYYYALADAFTIGDQYFQV